MPEITDPALLAQLGDVTVSEGRKGTGAAEAKSIEGGLSQSRAAADVVRGLAQAEALSRITPTGRFAVRVSEAGQQFPSGWQGDSIAKYQMLDSTAKGLLQPAVSLLSGKPLGVSQLNTPAELQFWSAAAPNASQEPAALRYNVDRLGSLAQRRIAEENFNAVWRSKLGSLSKTNAQGQTAQQAFEASLSTPRMAVLNKPISTYLTEAQRKRQAATAKPPPAGLPDDVAAILKKNGL